MNQPQTAEFEQELQAAKLRALAEFAAGAGHEINNPVATIVGYAQQLLAGEKDPDRRQALLTIGGQAYRIRDMIGDLMLFARPPQPRCEPLDLGAICREVTEKFAAEAESAKCALRVEAEQAVPVWGDPVQLRVVLCALCRNSLEATGEPQTIVVSATSGERAGEPVAVLTVVDQGRGLSELDRKHLFDPFYSGRPAGRGLGFGLSKAWRIVTQHGGRIEVSSGPERGVVVRVELPAAAPEAVKSATESAPQPE